MSKIICPEPGSQLTIGSATAPSEGVFTAVPVAVSEMLELERAEWAAQATKNAQAKWEAEQATAERDAENAGLIAAKEQDAIRWCVDKDRANRAEAKLAERDELLREALDGWEAALKAAEVMSGLKDAEEIVRPALQRIAEIRAKLGEGKS